MISEDPTLKDLLEGRGGGGGGGGAKKGAKKAGRKAAKAAKKAAVKRGAGKKAAKKGKTYRDLAEARYRRKLTAKETKELIRLGRRVSPAQRAVVNREAQRKLRRE